MTIDPDSPTWRAIQAELEREIDKARMELDKEGTPERRSDFLRGQLSAWRMVLSASAPRTPRRVPAAEYSA